MKDRGLFQKYYVEKLANPHKKIDAIVLEFDDPISRIALRKYSTVLRANGFIEFARDIVSKCNEYEISMGGERSKRDFNDALESENQTLREIVELLKTSAKEVDDVISTTSYSIIDGKRCFDGNEYVWPYKGAEMLRTALKQVEILEKKLEGK